MNQSASTRYYLTLSALIFLFYFAWSSTTALLARWLGTILELDTTMSGFVFMANAIGALLFQPLYGAIQDRLGTSKKLLIWIGIMLALCTPIMGSVFVYLMRNVSQFVGMTVSGLYLALALFAAAGVVDSYCERAGRNAKIEYGKIRLWGAIGWGLGTLIAGRFDITPNLPFYACSVAGIVFLFVLSTLNDKDLLVNNKPEEAQHISSMSQSLVVLKDATFWKFTVFLFGIAGMYFLFDQQFQNHYASFFPGYGEQAYSWLYASETVIETVALAIVPFVANKIGARNSLILSAFIMGMRILGTGLFNDVWLITGCYMFRGFEIPLLLVAVFKYMTGVFDARYSSTIYLIAFQFAQQVFSICFAALTGYSLQHMGASFTYVSLGVITLLFMMWGVVMLPKIPRQASVSTKEMPAGMATTL